MILRNIVFSSAIMFSQFSLAEGTIYDQIACEENLSAHLRDRVWAAIEIGNYLIANQANLPQGVVDTRVNLDPVQHFQWALNIAHQHNDAAAVSAAEAGLEEVRRYQGAQTVVAPSEGWHNRRQQVLANFQARENPGIKDKIWFLIHLLNAYRERGTVNIQVRLLRLVDALSRRNQNLLRANRDLERALGRMRIQERLDNIQRLQSLNPEVEQEILSSETEQIVAQIEINTYRRRERPADEHQGRDFRQHQNARLSHDSESDDPYLSIVHQVVNRTASNVGNPEQQLVQQSSLSLLGSLSGASQ